MSARSKGFYAKNPSCHLCKASIDAMVKDAQEKNWIRRKLPQLPARRDASRASAVRSHCNTTCGTRTLNSKTLNPKP